MAAGSFPGGSESDLMAEFRFEVRHFLPMQYRANKAPEPTAPSVTIRADARLAPAAAVAHL